MIESGTEATRYVPFGEALRVFVPAALWDEYERALRAVSTAPCPSYLSMGVREWRDAMAVYRSRSGSRDHARTQVRTARARIINHLVERLVAGELTGVVQDDPPFGPWRAIPTLSWRSLEPVDIKAGHFRAGKTELRSVQVVEGRYEPPIPLSASGTRGRPSPKQLYLSEHQRRCETGAAFDGLSKEAEYLEKWMAQTHGAMAGATMKTIGNNIRKAHAAWKVSRSSAGRPETTKIKT